VSKTAVRDDKAQEPPTPTPVLCWHDGTQLRAIQLPAPGVTIGAATDCAVILEHESVSQLHASLLPNPQGGWMVRDESSTNGTYVAGQRIDSITSIPTGTTFEIVGIHFLLAQPAPHPELRAQLQIESGSMADQIKPIEGFLEVGTSDQCTLALSDRGISGRHASFHAFSGCVIIQDLQSTNGTFINGERLPRGGLAALHNRDDIRIGLAKISIRVRLGGGLSAKKTAFLSMWEILPSESSGELHEAMLRATAEATTAEKVNLETDDTEVCDVPRMDTEQFPIIRPKKSRKPIKIMLWSLLILVLLSGLTAGALALIKTDAHITTSGFLHPERRDFLRADYEGTIKEFLVKTGDRIKKGQNLLKVDPTGAKSKVEELTEKIKELKEKVKKAAKRGPSSELKKQKAQLTSSGISLRYAARNYKRAKKLYAKGLLSKQELDSSKESTESNSTSYRVAKLEYAEVEKREKKKVTKLKTRLKDAEEEIVGARKNLKKTHFVAPLSGMILLPKRSAMLKGVRVKEGQRLLQIIDDSAVNITIRVPLKYQRRAEVGAEIELRTASMSKTWLKSKISATSPTINTDSNETRYVVVRTRLTNEKHALKPGETASVRLAVGESSLLEQIKLRFMSKRIDKEEPETEVLDVEEIEAKGKETKGGGSSDSDEDE
jgi:HlyD family secretion protein